MSNFDISPGHIFNVTLDLTNKTSTRAQVSDTKAEFPASHPYRHGVAGTRFVYLMASERDDALPFREVVKVSDVSPKSGFSGSKLPKNRKTEQNKLNFFKIFGLGHE